MMKHTLQRKKPARVSVPLSEREQAALQTLKDRHNVSFAWLARQAVQEFIQRYENEQTKLPLKLTHEGHAK